MTIWNKTKANYERRQRITEAEAAAQLAEMTERIEREREAREIAAIVEWLGNESDAVSTGAEREIEFGSAEWFAEIKEIPY